MNYRSAKGFSGWGQVGVLLGFLGAGLIFAVLTQYLIGLPLVNAALPLDQQLQAMAKALLLPENAFYLQLSQALGTFLLLFLPALSYMHVCHGRDGLWLGFSRRLNIGQVFLYQRQCLSSVVSLGDDFHVSLMLQVRDDARTHYWMVIRNHDLNWRLPHCLPLAHELVRLFIGKHFRHKTNKSYTHEETPQYLFRGISISAAKQIARFSILFQSDFQ